MEKIGPAIRRYGRGQCQYPALTLGDIFRHSPVQRCQDVSVPPQSETMVIPAAGSTGDLGRLSG